MVKITINGIPIDVDENTTILEAAANANIYIPHLCFLKGINEIGACRVCIVEIEGMEHVVSACNNHVKEGMVIYTNSPKVRETRKTNVELILSQHDCKCAICSRSGNCVLQRISNDLGIIDIPYPHKVRPYKWSPRSPLIRDASKCIKCMRCVQVCEKIQTLNIWDVEGTGARVTIDTSQNRKIMDSDCSFCGQCITHCPVGALSERDETAKLFDAIADRSKKVVVQIAPAVRAAWGEELGLSPDEAQAGKMVSALKRMGVDYVFDTDFSADLTIMEEGSELLQRLKKGKQQYPLFTSCCPGWVRFMKSQFPEMVDCLSTAKSPQQMFGTIIKAYYAKKMGLKKEEIYSVSIMPCVAKKSERVIEHINDSGCESDVDLVLTTRELVRMVKADHVNIESLENLPFDEPLGEATGAGVIFGATGGVMEAALRSAFFLAEGKNTDADAFKDIRGSEGIKEAEFALGDKTLRVAVVNGLGNVRRIMRDIKSGKVCYDFVEVMACPGGCAGGGGQPIREGEELAGLRGSHLYFLDSKAQIRFSHENPAVAKLYQEFLGEPLSKKSHEYLHTAHKSE